MPCRRIRSLVNEKVLRVAICPQSWVRGERFRFANPRQKPPMRVRPSLLRTLAAIAGATFAVRIGLSLIRGNGGFADAILTAVVVSAICATLIHVWVIRDEARRASQTTAERAGKSRFRALMDAVAVGAVIVDTNGRIRDLNRKAEELFRYDRTELINQPVEMLVPERFREAHVGHRERYTSAPDPVPLGIGRELVARRRDGSEFPMELSLSPMTLEGEKLVLALVTDTTERRQIEADQALTQEVASHQAVSILITDLRGTIQYVNPAFEHMTGYSRDEVMGKNPRILKSGLQAKEFYQEMWARLRGGGVWESRFINRRKDGTLFEMEMTITPVMNAAGRVTHYVAVGRHVATAATSQPSGG